MKDIAIIGAGRLGTALGRALTRAGFRVRAVADQSPSAARRLAAELPDARPLRDNRAAAALAQAIFVCVPDSSIRGVARELAEPGVICLGKIVTHCSGALDAHELDPLRRRGALTASAHPVHSFPYRPTAANPFRGTPVGIEGQAKAVAWLKQTFARLGAKPLRLRPGVKPLYHAACVLASNDLVILMDMAEELLGEAGFSRREAGALLAPLAQGTLHDVNKLGTAKALTGPLVRGDEATVARHLHILKKFPRSREAYRKLALRGLDVVKRSGTRPEKIRALKRLLEDK